MKTDTRTLFVGALSLVAAIGTILLYALHNDTGATAIGALTTTLAAYLVGLNSEPHDGSE